MACREKQGARHGVLAGCKAWGAGCAGCKAWGKGRKAGAARERRRIRARLGAPCPNHGRGGPIGVLRHRPRAHARCPRLPGDGRRPGPDQPLRAQMGLGAAGQGLLSTGARRISSSAPLQLAESGSSQPSGGIPDWVYGSPARPPLDGPLAVRAWRELAQGAGGALRAGWQLLGHRLPSSVRRGRHPTADPVLADLERAQSAQVLRAAAVGARRTPACWRSPTTRSRAGIRRPGSCSPECPATGT